MNPFLRNQKVLIIVAAVLLVAALLVFAYPRYQEWSANRAAEKQAQEEYLALPAGERLLLDVVQQADPDQAHVLVGNSSNVTLSVNGVDVVPYRMALIPVSDAGMLKFTTNTREWEVTVPAGIRVAAGFGEDANSDLPRLWLMAFDGPDSDVTILNAVEIK